jgi:hypothetical protein
MIVETDDGLMVRLDRNAQNIYVTYSPFKWVKYEKAGMSEFQIAMVQYAADVALRESLGEYRLPEWKTLRDEDRIAFMRNAPKNNPLRESLYSSIRETLR